jgi:hypothetical protein
VFRKIGSVLAPHSIRPLRLNAGSLTVSNSLFCGQLIGHDIKSRAQVTVVSGNQLYDGAANAALGCNAASSSLAIDVPMVA